MILLVIGWVICGTLAYGIGNAFWRHEACTSFKILEDSQRDYLGPIVLVALAGPFGLFVMLIFSNFIQRGIYFGSWDSRDGLKGDK